MSAVQLGVKKKVYCILCIAENAIGSAAMRNDDILTMYSGKTVEGKFRPCHYFTLPCCSCRIIIGLMTKLFFETVNNCDAEGRLVLADGVAHATKHFDSLDLVVDMATLTGAQLVATG